MAGLALVLAAPASTATTTVQIKGHGVRAGHRDDQPGRHGHVDEHGHDRPPGRGERRLVRVADPRRRQDVHATFRGGGTFRYHDGLHPTLKGTVVGRGRAAAGVAGGVGARREVRRAGHAHRRGLEQAGRRDGHDRGSCPSGRPRSRSSRRCRRRAAVRSRSTSTPQLNTTYQAQWKGGRELGRRAGAADDQAAVRRQVGLLPLLRDRRPVVRGHASSSCSASRSRRRGSTSAGCSSGSSPAGSWG